MIALALEIAAAAWRSAAGRLAIVALLAGATGFYYGFKEGDSGRLLLQQQIAAATAELKRTEAIRQADIAAQSEREAEEQEKEMAAKDRDIEAANLRIEELEKGSKCSISRGTVRELNRAR